MSHLGPENPAFSGGDARPWVHLRDAGFVAVLAELARHASGWVFPRPLSRLSLLPGLALNIMWKPSDGCIFPGLATCDLTRVPGKS